MDIRQGVDLRDPVEKKRNELPTCPPCTMYSALQNLSGGVNPSRPHWREAMNMLDKSILINTKYIIK